MAPKGKQSKIAAQKTATAKSNVPPVPPPNWPALQPLLPSCDLSLQPLDPLPNDIVLIPNFLTTNLCKTYVSFLSNLPLTTTPGKPKRGDAVRVNDRFQINDPIFAQRLWEETALKGLVLGVGDSEVQEDGGMTAEQRKMFWGGDVVGLNPSIRIYR